MSTRISSSRLTTPSPLSRHGGSSGRWAAGLTPCATPNPSPCTQKTLLRHAGAVIGYGCLAGAPGDTGMPYRYQPPVGFIQVLEPGESGDIRLPGEVRNAACMGCELRAPLGRHLSTADEPGQVPCTAGPTGL